MDRPIKTDLNLLARGVVVHQLVAMNFRRVSAAAMFGVKVPGADIEWTFVLQQTAVSVMLR